MGRSFEWRIMMRKCRAHLEGTELTTWPKSALRKARWGSWAGAWFVCALITPVQETGLCWESWELLPSSIFGKEKKRANFQFPDDLDHPEEEIGAGFMEDAGYSKNLSWRVILQIVTGQGWRGEGDNSNKICHGDPAATVALSANGKTFRSQLNTHSLCHQQDFAIFFVIINFLL